MSEPVTFPLVSLQLVSDRRQSVTALLPRLFRDDRQEWSALLAEDFLLQALGRLPCLLPLDPFLSLDSALPVDGVTLLAAPGLAHDPEVEALRARGFVVTSEMPALGVDTRARFEEARNAGAKWFAGVWYLERQDKIDTAQAASHALMLRLLQLVAADAETRELEAVFKQDPQLSYHLLKLVNSVAMGLPNKIGSFGQAIVILGRRQLQRWLNLLMFTRQQQDGRLAPLQASAVLRARLLELASAALGASREKQEQAFIVGMFSLLGTLFGMPTEQVIRPLNLADEIVGALLERRGELGLLLRLAEAAERADGEALAAALAQTGLSNRDFARVQFEACRWMLDVTLGGGDG